MLTFGRELLRDGSFELAVFEHWEPRLHAGQLIEISSSVASTGDRSLHMTAPPSEENQARVILRERFPAQAGTSIRLAYSAMQMNNGWAELLVDYYDGNGLFVSRSSTGRSDGTDGQWMQHGEILDIQAGIATALLTIRLQTQPAPGQPVSPSHGVPEIFVDDVSVRQVFE